MTYDCTHFLRKYSAIPGSKWCVGMYSKNDRHCAMWFCSKEEADALIALFSLLDLHPPHVNDGLTTYQQPTPRQRILAALRDVQRMQQRIVYVAVPETILQECETVLN